MTFMARAAAPTLPAWLVLMRIKRVFKALTQSELQSGKVKFTLSLPPIAGLQPSSFFPTSMSANLHPMLNVAIKAARAAGAIINRAALDVESVRISTKQVNDFVTDIDKKAEEAIIETLLTAYPAHGILAEESGSEHGAQGSDFVWIIDPLDGTTNFIHGFPVYCVSIALAVKGKVEQAVVYDPTRNDMFCATKGRGAYMNDRRIRVSKRTRLQECLISTGFPYQPGNKLRQHLAMLGEIITQSAGVRRPGAAALDLAYVAAGFSDVAAGSLLITEAGGLVGNYTGDSDFLHVGECVAANPRIYGQMVATLAKYSQFEAAPKAKKTSVGRPVLDAPEDTTVEVAFVQAKPTLTAKSRRIKPAQVVAPDAPF